MPNLNEVRIMGHLGRDPELRHTQSGKSVCNFSVAVSEKWKTGDQQQEHTEWFSCVAWEQRGEIIAQYFHKGDSIYIGGRLRTRKWEDQHGQTRYTPEVIVSDFQFTGGKRYQENNNTPPKEATAAEYRKASMEAQAPPKAKEPEQAGFDDDVPF